MCMSFYLQMYKGKTHNGRGRSFMIRNNILVVGNFRYTFHFYYTGESFHHYLLCFIINSVRNVLYAMCCMLCLYHMPYTDIQYHGIWLTFKCNCCNMTIKNNMNQNVIALSLPSYSLRGDKKCKHLHDHVGYTQYKNSIQCRENVFETFFGLLFLVIFIFF